VDSPAEHALFERLRKLRKRLADHSGVPPYVIFHDYTLREMARQAPTSIAEFAAIPGVGQAKLARYGQMFTDEIRAGLENGQGLS
jgi:ATP-dependent DNA helicase RecQ